jgi:pimeloyl-ACP methyl ester carboxylesterase
VLEVIRSNDNYRIIALDQRGFGKSTYNQSVTRFAQHAEDLVDFIKLKHLNNVTLVGWSYGGGISMKTAEIAP